MNRYMCGRFLIPYYLAPFRGPGFSSQVVYLLVSLSFSPDSLLFQIPTNTTWCPDSPIYQNVALSHNGGLVKNEKHIRSKHIPQFPQLQ